MEAVHPRLELRGESGVKERRRPRYAPRLLVVGVTAEQWTARYGVKPYSHACGRCGRVLTTTEPFAKGTLRGLRAPTCLCGNERTPYVVVRDPKYGDLFTGA
jgi:hypothetical protein